ncbi:MAG: serine/threonine-protein kinase HipA [Paraglaciecola sp.]|jgi:serine/threonine-protein kinase HipA
MSRELDVYIDQTVVGKLSEQDNIWSFQYDANWLSNTDSYPLSPEIPLIPEKQTDGSSTRHIQWYMDNLLPEEEARKLLAKDIREPVEDTFALLTKAGAESAGAITLMPSGTPLPQGDHYQLTEDEISKRIKTLPQSPMNRSERKRMSLAGAQHKMLVIYKDGQLYEPSGQMPSTHI